MFNFRVKSKKLSSNSSSSKVKNQCRFLTNHVRSSFLRCISRNTIQLLAAKHKTIVSKCVSNYSYLRLALITLAFSVLMARAFHCAVLAISSDMFTTEGSRLKNKHTFWLVFNTLQQHYTYCHSSFTSVVPSFNIYTATS